MGSGLWNTDRASATAAQDDMKAGQPGKSTDKPKVSKQNESTQDSVDTGDSTTVKDRRSIRGKERSLLSMGNKKSTSILDSK